MGVRLQAEMRVQVQGWDVSYRPLTDYIIARGGILVRAHPGFRDRLIDLAIEEFPVGASPVEAADLLRARLCARIRREHGSVVATLLIGLLVNLIVRLVIEWWLSSRSHRILMEGWQAHALEAAGIPPTS